VVIGALTLIALGVTVLRVEQTRTAARTVAMENEWAALRRESWRLQTALARLRAPGTIHDRTQWIQTDLVAPGSPHDGKRDGRYAVSRN
jgi:hypothetical protein